MTLGGQRDVPEAVGSVAESLDDDVSVFDYAYVVLFVDGDEGPGVESLQDVTGRRAGRQLWSKWDLGSVGGGHVVAICRENGNLVG